MSFTGKIWFITGASRGFGRLWANAALERGDGVAATARNPNMLGELSSAHGARFLPLELDVTDHAGVAAAVGEAHRYFGRLDVVLSNAGYGMLGALEEATVDEARANFETNVIGTLSVVQAAVPLLRMQGHGHILAVSSVGGLVALPLGGIYQASKFAVEGMVQTLALEVADFGIDVTLIEPGPFATEFMDERSLRQAAPIAIYDPMRERLARELSPEMLDDPRRTIEPLMRIIDADRPPRHLMLGSMLPMVKDVYAARIRDWEMWGGAGA